MLQQGLYHMTRMMEWDNLMRSLQQHHQLQLTAGISNNLTNATTTTTSNDPSAHDHSDTILASGTTNGTKND